VTFYHAYLRAAFAATAVVVGAGLIAIALGAIFERPPVLEALLPIPLAAALVIAYTFALTLVVGTLGHWLLRRFRWRARAHYVICGVAFGWVAPWLLLGRPEDVRWNVLAGAVFAGAGGLAAATFWKLHVRDA